MKFVMKGAIVIDQANTNICKAIYYVVYMKK